MLVAVERRARLIGVNHVALEVGDLEAALALYGRLFDFELRGRAAGAAFIDMGDQFIAVMQGRGQPADDERHFGLVVDDIAAVRAAVEREGLTIVHPGARGLDFLDPWGNHFQIVAYEAIQFERSPGVKRKLGIEQLGKTDAARREIEERGSRESSAREPRDALGEAGALLERVRDLEQRAFAERSRHELQPDRQARAAEADGHGDRRAAGHADA